MTAARRTIQHEPIAIVGIGCRFPGGIADPASYWRALTEGLDAIAEIPADRIDLARWFDPRPATTGRMMTRWGGFLDRIEEFDALAFGISPREAERIDPQQRLVLETAWEALEDAGQDVDRLEGSRTGVFVGQWLSDFESRIFSDAAGVDFYMTTGSGRYATSGRLSYTLGLHGPSLTLDTACSSSLVAVHLAVQSIRSGESDLALAGGVNIILQPQISIAYSQSLMMAPDGRCKFGDAAGDGYVRSEGAGVILLKPLARAQADGDRIYAVVRGSAVNNDGHGSGSLGTPSQAGQEDLLRTAYLDAGVSPGSVGYVEAHGTGTRVGDPVELGALGAVLGEGRAAGAQCAVGSVKSNFGHTEGAAGIAGLIKAALALRHGAIPPSLHLKERNPAVPWAAIPLEIPTEFREWTAATGCRVAGVSAFGIGGTNAHVVLEQAPVAATASVENAARPLSLLALSAKSAEALRALAGRHAALLETPIAPSLRDVCWSAATRRTALQHRAAFVAADGAAMAAALRRYAEGERLVAEGDVQPRTRIKVAFICPGQGAQWVGMGRELAAREPVFLAMLQRCDHSARPYIDCSIVEQLHCEPGNTVWRLDDIGVIQPVLVALSIAYAELWKSLGIVPDAVIGHSMGEVAAAFIAGVLDLDQAMRIICRRSALMRRASGRGAMLLVESSIDDARARIAGREDLLSVAVSNSPRSSVISGDPGAIHEVLAELEREQVFCRLIKVDVASHSPQMEPLAKELGAELAGLVPNSARIPIYSTVTGRRAEGTEFNAAYWASNLRQPVQFASATKELLGDGITVFVELGPHPVLLPSVEQTAQSLDRPARMIACGRREEPEQATFVEAVGASWTAGVAVDWGKVMPDGGSFAPLPLYPWQRERHWADAAAVTAEGSIDHRVASASEAPHPYLAIRSEIGGNPPGKIWDVSLDSRLIPSLGEHRLHGAQILAASAYLELALAAVRRLDFSTPVDIVELSFDRALYLSVDSPTHLQLAAIPDASATKLRWSSRIGDSWSRNAHARVECVPSTAQPSAFREAESRLTSGTSREGADVYAELEGRGVHFGPALRAIARAWIGTDASIAELVSLPANTAGHGSFEIAPSAIDACFQLAVASVSERELWVPSVLRRVRRYRAGGVPTRVLVRRSAAPDTRARSRDVTLLDSDGPILEIEGLVLEPLMRDATPSPRESLFAMRWEECPLGPAAPARRTWVLVADRLGTGAALTEAIVSGGERAVVVRAGDAIDASEFANVIAGAARMDAAAQLEVVFLRGLDVDAQPDAASGVLHDLVCVVQALDRFDGARRRCWVVTRGARAVVDADRVALTVGQAPLWGLGAAAAAEHPALWGGCIDIDATLPAPAIAAALFGEMANGTGGDASFRGGIRFAPRLAPLNMDPADMASATFRADSTYLITGGLGGVGARVAHWMIERGARRLAIVGRGALPARTNWKNVDPQSTQGRAIATIRSLEAMGATVHCASVDVANEADLARFLAEFGSEQWPPIRGVWHAAGVTDDRLIAKLDRPSLDRVLAGKMFGAWHLHRLLPDVEQFVLFSSVADMLAQPGQASYAAANAFLDALANLRRGQGKPALSVNWGVWLGLGFAATVGGAQASERLAKMGAEPCSASWALAALDAALASDAPQVVAFPLDRAVLRTALADGSLASHAQRLLSKLGSAPPTDAPTRADVAESFADSLRNTEPGQRRPVLEDRLARHASAILRLAVARLDRRTPLGSYGLSSLLALELRNRIESELGFPISATALWNYPTIIALAEHLSARMEPAQQGRTTSEAFAGTSTANAPARARAVAEVAALSDEMALAALARPPRSAPRKR